MVLESADCAFCWALAVIARRDQLVFPAVVRDCVNEDLGCFVVELEKAWYKTGLGEGVVTFMVAAGYFFSFSGFHRKRFDIPAVIIIEYKDIFVSATGGGGKPTSDVEASDPIVMLGG